MFSRKQQMHAVSLGGSWTFDRALQKNSQRNNLVPATYRYAWYTQREWIFGLLLVFSNSILKPCSIVEEYISDLCQEKIYTYCNDSRKHTSVFLAYGMFTVITLRIYLLRWDKGCLLYTSPSPRDLSTSRMPSSA